MSFLGASDGKESSWNAGGLGSIPGSGRSPGEGNGNPFRHSCLKNSMDRGVWQAVHGGHKESNMTEQLTLPLHHLWGWIHMHFLFKIYFENWPYILTFFHWIAVYLFSVLFKGINSCHFEYVVNIFLLSTLSLAVYFVKI